jgi:hypothetical protein
VTFLNHSLISQPGNIWAKLLPKRAMNTTLGQFTSNPHTPLFWIHFNIIRTSLRCKTATPFSRGLPITFLHPFGTHVQPSAPAPSYCSHRCHQNDVSATQWCLNSENDMIASDASCCHGNGAADEQFDITVTSVYVLRGKTGRNPITVIFKHCLQTEWQLLFWTKQKIKFWS